MLIAILHNAVAEHAPPDERDVLVQVGEVQTALTEVGHESVTVACDLDLQHLREAMTSLRPAAVFNLVESLGGFDRLAQFVPALLDMLGIPFTGASAEALVLTNDKLLAKQQLRGAGLPTPDWVSQGDDHLAGGPPAEAYI